MTQLDLPMVMEADLPKDKRPCNSIHKVLGIRVLKASKYSETPMKYRLIIGPAAPDKTIHP